MRPAQCHNPAAQQENAMPFIQVGTKKILFVHIPRTGGTTTEHWLRGFAPLRLFTFGVPSCLKCTPQHLTWSDIEALFGEGYFDYGFAIVRNPYRRLESEYKLRHALAKQGFFKGIETFPAWVETTLAQARGNPWILDNHIRPQWQFASRHMRIFKFEDGLETIWATVRDEAGLSVHTPAPPSQLGTEAFDGVIDWDIREINLVREFYRQDFETFGYDPDADPTR